MEELRFEGAKVKNCRLSINKLGFSEYVLTLTTRDPKVMEFAQIAGNNTLGITGDPEQQSLLDQPENGEESKE